jgi:hypothetical protein
MAAAAAGPPSFDASQVSPQDALVTMRSLRRRFAEAFDGAEDPAALARRPPGGGLSPLDHAAWTATALEAVGVALDRVALADNPDIELPAADPPAAVAGPSEGASTVLSRLGDVARAVTDLMSHIHGTEWARTGRADGIAVSALDVVRRGVEIGVNHLRATEWTLLAERESPWDE